MTTITKEWLQQTIAEFENTRDDIPFGLDDDDAKILLVLKRALASLDAEPVRYLNKFSGTCVTLEQQSNAADDVAVYIPLYTAPPVPVVPEEAYSDDCPDLYASQPEAWAAGWNACRAALLHGAEPVSQTYELPQTQFEQVADLYEMQFDDGRTCAFHTDGAKAAQWLLACDGNKVQEYVRLERYHEALIGNSPVIPDDWVMVPKKLTAENGAKSLLSGEFLETTFISFPECLADEECESCDGSGRIKIEVPVSWTTIKAIWNKGVEHFRSSTATGDN
ncbi:hypothetical protein CTB09_23235 [Salmonella enterica]|uniref:DUF551 domain-containing protein n=10 Tax=Salmonella enterica TaxID=28901 RepID=A0A6Y5D8Z7_SALDE|nr:hypothetical protein [Salmonella enterica]EAA5544719.1 hypothetical protein [Salmonella enterica subsp. enterica serovar Abony]EBX0528992.1 hypothetical protein [Salmonella enterica subsp. enterica serovar Liverpool]EBY2615687.1 hypothetical protein [Salmonella enterica subsp. enterica serovar Newport]ECB6004650.1 hypothetical protein [Salmonella enterica subsp. enterica serovar Hvittingfoss]ECK8628457.1 hypothetical protein [Salmonella enterica subsp. enterica serovar Enteritidis]ECN01397